MCRGRDGGGRGRGGGGGLSFFVGLFCGFVKRRGEVELGGRRRRFGWVSIVLKSLGKWGFLCQAFCGFMSSEVFLGYSYWSLRFFGYGSCEGMFTDVEVGLKSGVIVLDGV